MSAKEKKYKKFELIDLPPWPPGQERYRGPLKGRVRFIIPSKGVGISKTLEAEYYANLLKEQKAQKTKKERRYNQTSLEKCQAIADDLRTMTQAAVMAKHRCNIALIDRILGDMSIGKYKKRA